MPCRGSLQAMVKVVVLALVVALTGRGRSSLGIRSHAEGLAGVRGTSTEMKLSVARDPAVSDGAVLLVEYPAATGNPAARDVWCEAEHVDWTAGHAIAFKAKPDHAMRISVSFMDRNRVAYTSWSELRAGEWQTVRI